MTIFGIRNSVSFRGIVLIGEIEENGTRLPIESGRDLEIWSRDERRGTHQIILSLFP